MIDGSISLSFNGRFGSLKFDWVADLRDKHNGEEFDLTYRCRFNRGRWMFSPFISYIYQDKDLTNYYYGISENEALPGRPAYQTDEAFFVRAGVNSSYQLIKHWLIYANVAFEGLDDSLRESPLTEYVPLCGTAWFWRRLRLWQWFRI
jgi:outer membrane protein